MCDLNWCPVCEKAISCESDALYCSVSCFLLDTKNQINPTKFLSFLKPKSLLRRKKQEEQSSSNNMPPLTKSIYTSSSLSSSESHFDFGDATHDDLELPECCDYCDSVKQVQQQQQQPHQKPSSDDFILYQIPSSDPISIPIR